ncbi:hypothetical protein UlMin_031321 [Ulmus minor]
MATVGVGGFEGESGRGVGFRPGNNQDQSYTELWHACAGSKVCVPRAGEKVYYFPQGHVEQIRAFYADQDGNMEMPVYNLPTKILCRVVNVKLKVEAQTDEVYAEYALVPATKEHGSENANDPALPQKANTFGFTKGLTPSDTSTHGGLSVPKRYADECFPPLDTSQQTPTQELVARDLHGSEWRFRHIYRGQPKRHLLTSGWSTFVSAKKLTPGDSCTFVRGEDGKLRVGVRPAINKRSPNNAAASVLSGYSMQHGILANAYHAISTGTLFTVYYHPWTSTAEYVVPHEKYAKIAEKEFSVGTKFKYGIEIEECAEKRHSGIIVKIEDHDSKRWPGSEWRCLKVKWDSLRASLLPQRLSPWELVLPTKRGRPLDLPAADPGLARDAKRVPQRHNEVLQGQEFMNIPAYGPRVPIFSKLLMPPNPYWNLPQPQFANHLGFPVQNPFYQFQWPSMFSAYNGAQENVASSRSFSVSNGNSSNSENNGNAQSGCRLFGVNLSPKSHPELPSLQEGLATTSEHTSPFIPPISQSSNSEANKQVSSKKLCIKVLKSGTPLGRTVDLAHFDGYNDLISELDKIFEFNGSLKDGSSGWKVTYKDNEGNLMLVGDDFEWQKFCSTVQRIFIYPNDDINKFNPGSLLESI